MRLSEHTILIGACGWQHPQWNENFYPEDLPQDWQLGYYGNEYPVVLVPADYWTQGMAAVESWLEETDTRPGFICEWTITGTQSVMDSPAQMVQALGERVLGILIPLDRMPTSLQLEQIDELLQSYPVCLEWPNADPQQLQELLTHRLIAQRVSVCWHGDETDRSLLAHGSLALARVNSAGQTPRSLRTILETLLASAGQRRAVLLFDGQPPDTEVMETAEVILNLL